MTDLVFRCGNCCVELEENFCPTCGQMLRPLSQGGGLPAPEETRPAAAVSPPWLSGQPLGTNSDGGSAQTSPGSAPTLRNGV